MSDKISSKTKEYKMNGVNFITSFIFRYAWIWIVALCILGLLGLCLGLTVDLRLFIVGLMIIMIIMPMLAAFLYFFYGLKKECYINTVNHYIEFDNEGLSITLLFGTRNEDNRQMRVERFTYSEFDSLQIGPKSVTIYFKSPKKGFIWIPAYAFEDENTIAGTLSFIDEKIRPHIILSKQY